MNSYDSIISLSLGTAAEPSGLVVIKPWSSLYPPDGLAPEAGVGNRFDVRWIERFPAGRPLPAIINRVFEVTSLKEVSRESIILLDISSVGTAPLRAFQTRGMYPATIDLTSTAAVGYANDALQVPLRDVIGAAQVVLETARLKVASGLDLANELRALSPELRVLMMSGYPKAVLDEQGVSAAELELMAKPFTPRELRRRVSELLADRA